MRGSWKGIGLGLVLCLLWSSHGYGRARNEVARPVVACLQECQSVRNDCARQRPVGPICQDHHRVCVERCDPKRTSTASIQALYPPESRVVDGPRDKLPLEQQLAICRQGCETSHHLCVSSGNSVTVTPPMRSGTATASDGCGMAAQRCGMDCQRKIDALVAQTAAMAGHPSKAGIRKKLPKSTAVSASDE